MACGSDSNSPSAAPTPTPVSRFRKPARASRWSRSIRSVTSAMSQFTSSIASGNAQLAVVDLTVGAVNPVLKTISLTGSVQPISEVYNPHGPSILAEARDGANQVHIYEIDPATESVVSSIIATGLSDTGMSGGIVENFVSNQAIVAGTSDLGILDTSTSPPTWNQASIIDLSDMQITIDSMALDSFTGLLFISNLGNNIVIDTGELAADADRLSDRSQRKPFQWGRVRRRHQHPVSVPDEQVRQQLCVQFQETSI